jgi:hypothetical protein
MAFRSVGTDDNNGNSAALVPGAPAGKANGDLLLLYTGNRANTQSIAALTGWTQLAASNATNGSLELWVRIADGTGTDTPSPDWTGTNDSYAWIEAYSDQGYTDLATIIQDAVVADDSGATTDLLIPARTVSVNDALLVAFTQRAKTPTSDDATTITAPAGLTKRKQLILSATSVAAMSASTQQTTATNYGGADATINGTAESTSSRGIILTLKTIAATPTFDANPSIASVTATAYTINYDASANAVTAYFGSYPAHATAPTAAQLKAGTGAHGTASEATTGAADSIVLTPSDTPKFPKYKIYAVLENAQGFSSVFSLGDQFLAIPAGEGRVTLTSVAVNSLAEKVSAVIGDILTWVNATTPSSYTSSISAAGQVSYPSAGDNSRQIGLARRFIDASDVYANGGDQYEWVINNLPPAPSVQAFLDPILLRKSVAMTAISLLPRVSDPNADTVTTSAQTALPTGITDTADELVGTPTVYGQSNSNLRWTDLYGDFYEELVTFQIGDLTANVIGQAQATATTNIQAVASMTVTISQANSSTVAVGNVISQNPGALELAPNNQIVDLVISLGPANTAVPNILNVSMPGARTLITEALLNFGTITYAVDPANLYKVTAQSPAADSVVAVGATVNYTVAVLGEVVKGHGSPRRRH